MRSRPTHERSHRRAATAVAVALVSALAIATSGCVGKLGRNDDDVKPDSKRPSVNHAVRLPEPLPLPLTARHG